MVQLVGKYELVSSENFEEFTKSIGHQELTSGFLTAKPMIEIKQEGDQWTILVTVDGGSSAATFKLNEPYEEKLPVSQRKFQSVATMEGDKIKITTDVADGVKLFRLYEFTDADMKVHLSTNKFETKASRTYKRV